MRIACPSCKAAYEVPEDKLAAGRAVRCARCGAEWAPIAALPAAPPVPPPPPRPRPGNTPFTRPSPPPARPVTRAPERADWPPLAPPEPEERASRAGVALAWLLSLAVLAAAGWAAVTYRADIVRLWPPSERAYTALGLR